MSRDIEKLTKQVRIISSRLRDNRLTDEERKSTQRALETKLGHLRRLAASIPNR